MKLMSNTAASYPMGAGRFEPWLFANCYRDKEPWLETSCTHLIRSCSIAHQIHVVSTDAAMSLYGIIKICHLSPPCGGGRQVIGVQSHTIMPCIPGKCRIDSHTCRFLYPQLKLSTHTKNRCKGLYVVSVCLCACTHAPPTHSAMTIVHICDSVCMC